MIEALQPLADLPGVEMVMFLSEDGVPISVPGTALGSEGGGDEGGHLGREDALAALAANWQSEIAQAVAPLTWAAPERIVLRCARGTLVMRRAHGALLLVLLSRGQGGEEVRLAMEGTTARIERSLRTEREETRDPEDVEAPPPALGTDTGGIGHGSPTPAENTQSRGASSGH